MAQGEIRLWVYFYTIFLNENQGNIHKVLGVFHAASFYVFCALYLNAVLLITFSEILVWSKILYFNKWNKALNSLVQKNSFKWKELLLSTGIFAKYFLNGLLCPSNPEIKNISWITMTHQKIKLMWGFHYKNWASVCYSFH